MKKRVLLIYSENNMEKLDSICELLTYTLKKLGIDGIVETCSLFNSSTKSIEKYDILAGYHIDTDSELSFSQKFSDHYMHFFDNYHRFAFVSVTKREEMGGYRTYTISPVAVN